MCPGQKLKIPSPILKVSTASKIYPLHVFMHFDINREKDIYEIYKQVRDRADENYLKHLLIEKKLSISDANKEGVNALILAVDCEFSAKILDFILELGTDIHSQDAQGRTALHYAVDLENEEIITFLINKGANPHQQDSSGSTPIDGCDEDLLKNISSLVVENK